MSKQRIQDSIISSASILVIVLVALVAFLLQNRTEYWVLHTNNVKVQVIEVFDLVQGAESNLRGYLLTGDTSYIQPHFEATKIKVSTQFHSLADLVKDNPVQVATLARYQAHCKAKLNIIDSTYLMFNAGRREKAMQIVKTGVGESLMNKAEMLKNKMLEVENQLLYERQHFNIILQQISLALLTLATIFACFSLYRLYKRIGPLITNLDISNANLRESIEEKNKEITLRAAAEAKNEELIKMLTGKNEELNHFAYIASHDLQEPLRTVNNFIDVFKEDYGDKLDDDAHQYFDFIIGATTRMKALIEGLLSYSRLGKSRGAERVDLNEVMEGVKINLTAAIMTKNALVDFEPLPTVVCMKTEITQLFQNLVNNALKYTAPDVAPRVFVKVKEKNSSWEFCIEDNGIGIPPEQQTKIFNMFSRLHGDGEYHGQGIGLAFCKKIVELHNGKIWVKSNIGQGSSFYFTISKKLKDETEA